MPSSCHTVVWHPLVRIHKLQDEEEGWMTSYSSQQTITHVQKHLNTIGAMFDDGCWCCAAVKVLPSTLHTLTKHTLPSKNTWRRAFLPIISETSTTGLLRLPTGNNSNAGSGTPLSRTRGIPVLISDWLSPETTEQFYRPLLIKGAQC